MTKVTTALIHERRIYTHSILVFEWALSENLDRIPFVMLAQKTRARTPWTRSCPDIKPMIEAGLRTGWALRSVSTRKSPTKHLEFRCMPKEKPVRKRKSRKRTT